MQGETGILKLISADERRPKKKTDIVANYEKSIDFFF